MCTVNIVCSVLSTDNVRTINSDCSILLLCCLLCIGYHGIVKYSLNFILTRQLTMYIIITVIVGIKRQCNA